MAKAVITAEQLDLARQALACGDDVPEIADRLGVAYNTLWRRLTRAGLLPRQSRGAVRREELIFAARCPECSELVKTSQRGEEGTAFARWVALARRHARSRHAFTSERAQTWAEWLWSRSGRRFSVSIPGTPPPGPVKAAT